APDPARRASIRTQVATVLRERVSHMHLEESSVQAMRDMLKLCRRKKIAVVLVALPEGPDFRSWYSPAARSKWRGVLDGLRQEFGVPVVDAREWSLEDDFADGFHLNWNGAAAFTRRLGRDVIEPLLREPPTSQ